MNHVMDVRRRDTFEVQRNLQASETARADLEKEVEQLRKGYHEHDEELEALRRFKEMFGMATETA